MVRNLIFIGFMALMMAVVGCADNSTEPDTEEQIIELSEEEQAEIIAAELSSDNGGAIEDIEQASQAASEGFYKSAMDTSYSNDWMTYNISIGFYTANGDSQNQFIPGVTDRMDYVGDVNGSYESDSSEFVLELNRTVDFFIEDIISKNITVDGTGLNESHYFLGVRNRTREIKSSSTFVVDGVKVNLNSGFYLPYSGSISYQLKGTVKTTNTAGSGSFDFSIPFDMVFTGANTVTITLPSGTQFSLNVIAGTITFL